MSIRSSISNLIDLGTSVDQSIEISNRLKITNKFNLLCISYSIPYILFSIRMGFYEPALIFFVGQFFYIFSLYFNYKRRYDLAKALILISTNFSVFYLSLYYGFESGFHLYYFTTPLIVFSIFNFSEISKISVGISLYLVSIIALEILNMKGMVISHQVPEAMVHWLYTANTLLAMSFCLLMVTHFSSFNKKTNQILALKNEELEKKQELLEAEIIERKSAEIKLQSLLRDKETLLSETHHRVKNNLAVVSGMLDLQAMTSDDEKIKSVLSDSTSRIKSMSLIHESLYKYDNISKIEFGRYIETLANEIKNSYSSMPCHVTVYYDLDRVYLAVTKAIPAGLLINEILTNAFKHAFENKKEGKINIIFKQIDDICTLQISDNGIGIGDNAGNNSMSIGMNLINAFVKQLKGKYSLINDAGTKMTLTFTA